MNTSARWHTASLVVSSPCGDFLHVTKHSLWHVNWGGGIQRPSPVVTNLCHEKRDGIHDHKLGWSSGNVWIAWSLPKTVHKGWKRFKKGFLLDCLHIYMVVMPESKWQKSFSRCRYPLKCLHPCNSYHFRWRIVEIKVINDSEKNKAQFIRLTTVY